MEIKERIEKVREHLKTHPKDYQAVIAQLKLHSKEIDHERYKERIEKLKRIAEVRKERNEKRRQRNRDGRGHAEVDSSTRGNGDALSDTL